jgi:flagellar biosynthesis anti-sigma factor FlgM
MRIDINPFATIGSLQDSTPAQNATAARIDEEQNDAVTAQLSPDSQAVSSLASDDGVRQDRVAALRQALDSGTYQVNAASVAGAMMDNMLAARFTL